MGIVISNLSKSYGDKDVLQEFSCTFPDNTTTLVMGKSGCGKTTMLNILMGMEKADSGQITGIEGKRISAVFQENRLCKEFSVMENLLLVCQGKSKIPDALTLLERLDLKGCENQNVSELSGGMMRRVAIARALLVPFDILILDEPWKGLDKATKEKAIAVVMEYSKGKIVISVTHDGQEREQMKGLLLEM